MEIPDFIVKNSVKNAMAYPGADCNSDHNLVVMQAKLRLKRVSGSRKILKWDRVKLKCDSRSKFAEDLETYLKADAENMGNNSVENRWNLLKSAVFKSGEDNIDYEAKRKAKKPWVTEQMLDKME